MDTFGEKLRKAIEGQELGLEEVAQATGFQVHHLQAVQQDDFLNLYVCGGDETFATHTRWFCASDMTNGQAIIGERGWTLYYDNGHATFVDEQGVSTTMDLEETSDNEAALYESNDSGCHDGAIAWTENGETRVQGVWGCPGFGIQVEPVGTVRLRNRIELSAMHADGPRQFYMNRLN